MLLAHICAKISPFTFIYDLQFYWVENFECLLNSKGIFSLLSLIHHFSRYQMLFISWHLFFSFPKVFGFSFYLSILKFFDLCPFKHGNIFFSYKVFVVILLRLIISSSLLSLSWILELPLDFIIDLGSLIISLLHLFLLSFFGIFP